MFGSGALEVLIGLVFIFLLLATVCSAVVEGLAALRNWRGKTLANAVGRLLDPTSEAGLEKNEASKPSAPDAALAEFYRHPLIAALQKDPRRLPSYIPGDTFADVLIDLVGEAGEAGSPAERLGRVISAVNEDASDPSRTAIRISPRLARSLKIMVGKAAASGGDSDPDYARRFQRFRVEIERWFDRTMERTTGWYKRKTRIVLLLIAIVIVAAVNADTVSVARTLFREPMIRQALADAAETYAQRRQDLRATADRDVGADADSVDAVDEDGASEGAAADEARAMLTLVEETGLPLGWPDQAWKDLPVDEDGAKVLRPHLEYWGLKVVGLLVTALAVMLGAPFWFDMLNKLVSLRGVGRAPKIAIEEPDEPRPGDSRRDMEGEAAQPPAPIGPALGQPTPTSAAAGLPPTYWTDLVERAADVMSVLDPDQQRPRAVEERGLLLARMSALAYKSPGMIDAITQGLGFAGTRHVDRRSTQAFVTFSDRAVIVAFRGTEPHQLEDIMTDARIALMTIEPAGRVHNGFRSGLHDVLEDLTTALLTLREQAPQRPLYITGHSLGGALATLLFHELAQQVRDGDESGPISLYTFGCPRVGDRLFADAIEQAMKKHSFEAYRFVNNRDLVARVAPRALGYDHIPAVRYFDALGRLSTSLEKWKEFLLEVVDAAEDFRKAARRGIEDHAIGLYIQRLESWLSTQERA